jgi:hypothetical protein
MFEVASFDIGYNCILRRPFLLKFIGVVHTAYAAMKMLGPKGVITLKSNQCGALACENATLSQAGQFGTQAAEAQVAKMAKMPSGNT